MQRPEVILFFLKKTVSALLSRATRTRAATEEGARAGDWKGAARPLPGSNTKATPIDGGRGGKSCGGGVGRATWP